ncbi:MAG: hypothetical protein V1672_03510 [Candidatus Diapherotrites archaeon]
MNLGKIVLISFLLIQLISFVGASGAAAPDVNVTQIDGNPDNTTIPSFSYAEDENLTITFVVTDSDNNRLTVDINYSTTSAEGSGTVIKADLNLSTAEAKCTSEDFTTSPTCTWDWNIVSTSVSDGTYYILIKVFDAAKAAADVETDFNASDNTFIVDNTNPSIAITNATPCTSILPYTILTYSATEAGAGVQDYWVSTNNSTWTDNSTNTSYNFSIGAGTGLPFTQTYYVKVRDNADNNSSAASITCTYEAGGSETTDKCGDGTCQNTEDVESCPEDCKPGVVCGDDICDGTQGENSENCPDDCGTGEETPTGEEPTGETPTGEEPPVIVCASDSECSDNKECTIDRCTNNQCSHINAPDQTNCGFGKVCISGECQNIGTTQPPEMDFTLIAVVIIAILIAVYVYFKYLK